MIRYEGHVTVLRSLLTNPTGAKSWVECLPAVLSAGNVGRPSSGRVAQHPAFSVSVSPFESFVPWLGLTDAPK